MDILKIVKYFLETKKLENVWNFYVYLHSKFQDKRTYDAKVMTKKPHVWGQGDKK